MSTSCFLIRCNSRSSGPSKFVRRTGRSPRSGTFFTVEFTVLRMMPPTSSLSARNSAAHDCTEEHVAVSIASLNNASFTSGSAAIGSRVVTASGLKTPCLIGPMTVIDWCHITCVSPDIIAFIAGGVPPELVGPK